MVTIAVAVMKMMVLLIVGGAVRHDEGVTEEGYRDMTKGVTLVALVGGNET